MSAELVATATTPVTVQILHVPDCPNLAPLLARVRRCLTELGLPPTVELTAGDYPSPTLLVNGVDVLPTRPAGVCCRLDPPTDTQIRAALTRAATDRRS